MKKVIKEILGFPIGMVVVLFLPLIIKGIGRGLLANNCAENPLSEKLDKLALCKARELKQKKNRLEIGCNDLIEHYIDELDIYDSLESKEAELLKSHITNYYYNLKRK